MQQSFPTVKLSENYDDVILTPEETASALREARAEKHHKMKIEDYRRKIQEVRKYPVLDAEQLQAFALKRSYTQFKVEYTIDDDNRNIFNQLSYYFSGDERFEGDLNKRILLFGSVGTGKTLLMKMFSENHIQSYVVVPARNIVDSYLNDLTNGVDEYEVGTILRTATLHSVALGTSVFGHEKFGRCIDDLGTETNPLKHYGTEYNVIADIILKTYDFNTIRSPHITTNLSAEQIEQNYGTRFKDRLREMYNLIIFPSTAKSRRK